MSDFNFQLTDATPINVDIEQPQAIDVTVAQSSPIQVDLMQSQPINVDLDQAQPINVKLADVIKVITGGSNDKTYSQSFITQTSVVVNHALNKRPAVTVIDSAGDEVVGEVTHMTVNTLIVIFSAAFSGMIICN